MLWEEVEKKYGKALAAKMKKHMAGATCVIRKDGKFDIPEGDVRLAYKAAMGKKIHSFEWD